MSGSRSTSSREPTKRPTTALPLPRSGSNTLFQLLAWGWLSRAR
jgi:hypothetical protein